MRTLVVTSSPGEWRSLEVAGTGVQIARGATWRGGLLSEPMPFRDFDMVIFVDLRENPALDVVGAGSALGEINQLRQSSDKRFVIVMDSGILQSGVLDLFRGNVERVSPPSERLSFNEGSPLGRALKREAGNLRCEAEWPVIDQRSVGVNGIGKSVADVEQQVVLLPAITGANRVGTLGRLLASLSGWYPGMKSLESPAPEWTSLIKWPSLNEKEFQENSARRDLQQAMASHQAAADAVQEEHRWTQLLWASGDDLHDVAFQALRSLGIEAAKPKSTNDADLIIETPSTRFVLEVTGTQGAVDRDKVRQLREWVDMHSDLVVESDPNKSVRGVLLANPFRLLPPEERPSSQFTDAAVRLASDRAMVLTRTTELFALVTAPVADSMALAWTMLGGKPA